MTFEQEMYLTAKKFQLDNNLDQTDIPSLIRHEYNHARLNLGVSNQEEELVEYIENHLSFGLSWNSLGNELATTLPKEFLALYK